MQYSVRFFISWIASAIVMYLAFYAWHGLFLNDLNRISFSKALFLSLAAVVYLIISFLLYRSYQSKLFNKIENLFLKGIVVGAMIGFVLFAFIIVLGITFTKNYTLTYIIADCCWQIAEQIIGGLVIALGHLLIFEPTPEMIKRN